MSHNLEYDRAALRRVIRRVDGLGGAFAPIGPKVGNIIARHNRKQFSTKGAWFGDPWRPLAPSTIIQKRRRGFRAAPLVRTGAMKAGVTRAPMSKWIFTSTTGIYGTVERVARWQHFGTFRKGRRHIPPRHIVGSNATMHREIVQVIRNHVTR